MAIKFLTYLPRVSIIHLMKDSSCLYMVFVYGCVCGCAYIFKMSPSQETCHAVIIYYLSQCVKMPTKGGNRHSGEGPISDTFVVF